MNDTSLKLQVDFLRVVWRMPCLVSAVLLVPVARSGNVDLFRTRLGCVVGQLRFNEFFHIAWEDAFLCHGRSQSRADQHGAPGIGRSAGMSRMCWEETRMAPQKYDLHACQPLRASPPLLAPWLVCFPQAHSKDSRVRSATSLRLSGGPPLGWAWRASTFVPQ